MVDDPKAGLNTATTGGRLEAVEGCKRKECKRKECKRKECKSAFFLDCVQFSVLISMSWRCWGNGYISARESTLFFV
jgi:hypothetical protein